MRAPIALALASLALAGCFQSSDASTADVVATDHVFTPTSLEVDVGSTVTWVNEGKAPHTVSIPADERTYAYDEEFEAGEQLTYTFEEPGTYRVVCTYHPGMEMTVNVA